MKHIKWIMAIITFIVTINLIACKSPSGVSGSKKTYIGTKKPFEIKAVGDIVFNDGSATPYTVGLALTQEQKSKSIAVIYKLDGNKAWGVGLVHNKSGLVWCVSSAKGYNTNIVAIQCTPSGGSGSLTFTGDTDGSDNFSKIAQTLGNNDDTGILGKYPAFEFAKNYKEQRNSHVRGTAYESGWYLPTVAELFDIWKVKTIVDGASGLCGGSQFRVGAYWSSSQYSAPDYDAYAFGFEPGLWDECYKLNDYCVCCIRAFN